MEHIPRRCLFSLVGSSPRCLQSSTRSCYTPLSPRIARTYPHSLPVHPHRFSSLSFLQQPTSFTAVNFFGSNLDEPFAYPHRSHRQSLHLRYTTTLYAMLYPYPFLFCSSICTEYPSSSVSRATSLHIYFCCARMTHHSQKLQSS